MTFQIEFSASDDVTKALVELGRTEDATRFLLTIVVLLSQVSLKTKSSSLIVASRRPRYGSASRYPIASQ